MTSCNYTSEENSSNSDQHAAWWRSDQAVLVAPYTAILLLAVLGNGLVIVTLAVNKRMRTVTNLFLLNLAVSDLLLGVFCMPFTLAGVLLREFVFGELMCRLIPYLQAVSVCVSAWTLVAMSVERYFAICDPLRSRSWQTLRHAQRIIAAVWIASLLLMLPIAMLSQLKPIKDSGSATFAAVHPAEARPEARASMRVQPSGTIRWHQRDPDRSLATKQRIIRMLFVVVVEFFVCWTPLYVLNTVSLFRPEAVYYGLGYRGISFLQLLAYASSCCNPITYCFMNRTFRVSFLALFRRTCPQRDEGCVSMRNSMQHTFVYVVGH